MADAIQAGRLPGRQAPVRDTGGPRPFHPDWRSAGHASVFRIWLQVYLGIGGPRDEPTSSDESSSGSDSEPDELEGVSTQARTTRKDDSRGTTRTLSDGARDDSVADGLAGRLASRCL